MKGPCKHLPRAPPQQTMSRLPHFLSLMIREAGIHISFFFCLFVFQILIIDKLCGDDHVQKSHFVTAGISVRQTFIYIFVSKGYVKEGCELGQWLTKLDVAYLDPEWEGLSHLWSGGKSYDPNSFVCLEWNKTEAILLSLAIVWIPSKTNVFLVLCNWKYAVSLLIRRHMTRCKLGGSDTGWYWSG